MKSMTKLLAYLLLAVMILTTLSCGGESSTTSGERGEPSTPPTPEVIPAPDGAISVSELNVLQIVYPMGSKDGYSQSAVAIANAIKEKFSIEVEAVPDGYSTETTCEILLGACKNREATQNIEFRRNRDYFWRVDGKKLVLAAASENAVEDATEAFISRIIDSHDGSDMFYLGTRQDYTYMATYTVDDARLGKVNLLDCVIVLPELSIQYERETAERAAAHFLDMTGYTIPIVTEGKKHYATYELHVGMTQTVREEGLTVPEEADSYVISETSFGVSVLAESAYAYYAVGELFASSFVANNAVDKKIKVSLDEPMVGKGTDEPLRVMSFNILYIDRAIGMDIINPDRVPHVIETIKKANVDVIGLQEVTPEWKAYLLEYLSDEYAFVGEGRDGGNKGEHSAIMYRKDRFELLESDTIWLSLYPDQVSKIPESSLNRIATCVKLQRKSDGKVFVHINTHLDHKSEDANVKQGKYLLTLAKSFEGFPTFITGDFNANSKSQTYANMEKAGYKDSAKIAFDAVIDNTISGKVIDYCFVRGALVKTYRVDTTKYDYEQDPSDHCPVIIEAILK